MVNMTSEQSLSCPGASDQAVAGDVLHVKNLNVYFKSGDAEVQVVRDVSFSVRAGERVGIVGESGSGKSVTGLAVLTTDVRYGGSAGP